jgi:hypothetical protein
MQTIIIRRLKWSVFFMLIWNPAISQAPDGVPYGDPEPLELTPFNIILYIVVPVLLFVVLFLYRKSLKKKQRKDDIK